jgi:hypothetical protein
LFRGKEAIAAGKSKGRRRVTLNALVSTKSAGFNQIIAKSRGIDKFHPSKLQATALSCNPQKNPRLPDMKNKYLAASLALGAAASVDAASIGVNFTENDGNQGWLNPASLIGPTNIAAGNFNTTNNPPGAPGLPTRTGTLGTGGIAGLVNDSGAPTTAAVNWSSSGAWWNPVDGTGTDQQRLAVGYLDDGGTGISITVTDVPFAEYRVYGLLSSDQGNTYTTLDFTVNGIPVLGGTATAYGNIGTSFTNTGSDWSLLTTSQTGNYWLSGVQTATTLTITAPARTGDSRGSITGFVIQQVPEPSVPLFSIVALGGLALRRKRQG